VAQAGHRAKHPSPHPTTARRSHLAPPLSAGGVVDLARRGGASGSAATAGQAAERGGCCGWAGGGCGSAGAGRTASAAAELPADDGRTADGWTTSAAAQTWLRRAWYASHRVRRESTRGYASTRQKKFGRACPGNTGNSYIDTKSLSMIKTLRGTGHSIQKHKHIT